MTAPALARDAKITDLFLMGNPLDTIASTGQSRGAWNRADCLRVASENGWALDSSGRLPREQRVRRPAAQSSTPPAGSLGPGRAQVAAMLSQPPAAAQPDPAVQLIAAGRAHSVARVRKLAEKADGLLEQLRRAIAHEAGREELRKRLAELDAEREQLRAKLAGPGRPPKATATATPEAPAVKPEAGLGKPIDHGTWGGFLTEKARGLDHCDACVAAKDETMAKRRAPRQEAAE